MRIGPRYKIARRLGADLFEKTSSPKYALRAGRGAPTGYNRSDFGMQLREKQRARMLYGLGDRQFRKYVKDVHERKGVRYDEALFRTLETRLDNVIYRLGIAPTRLAARQLASHGHLLVNNVRITTPSYRVRTGDVIRIRSGSEKKMPFQNLADRLRDHLPPPWLRVDVARRESTVVGMPRLVRAELPFNIAAILEFYRR